MVAQNGSTFIHPAKPAKPELVQKAELRHAQALICDA